MEINVFCKKNAPLLKVVGGSIRRRPDDTSGATILDIENVKYRLLIEGA